MKTGEALRVKGQVNRAKALGVEATLTVEEWERTITDFNRLCAYCQRAVFDVLEHFVPITIVGTTVSNCIPACRVCNAKKRDSTGDALVGIFGEGVINRIAQYLASRHNGDVAPRSPLQIPSRPNWSTSPKTDRYAPSIIEEKSIYDVQELYEHLAVSISILATIAGVTDKTFFRVVC